MTPAMRTALGMLLLLVTASCVTPPEYAAFVRADRLRKAAIGDSWVCYVAADASKTEAQKHDAALLLESWEADLSANEARVGVVK